MNYVYRPNCLLFGQSINGEIYTEKRSTDLVFCRFIGDTLDFDTSRSVSGSQTEEAYLLETLLTLTRPALLAEVRQKKLM